MPSFSYILVALVILLTPGPTNTLLAAAGAALGLRRALILPLAETLGYGIAISVFFAMAATLADHPLALAWLRGLAALWLVVVGLSLWRRPVLAEAGSLRSSFAQVAITTLFNPKAMLVGTVVIPDIMPVAPVAALAVFLVLSFFAGLCWTLLGSAVPERIRPYGYKLASVAVLGFAAAAAVAALRMV